ncbi:hypothetical protein D9M73_216970 [compost metagenome]
MHAALFEAAGGIEETRFEEGVDRRFHFRDQGCGAVDVFRLLFIALAVVRGEELLGDAAGGAQGGIEGFAVVIGETLALGQGFGVEDFVELEGQVAGTEQGLGHDGSPVGSAESRSVNEGCPAAFMSVIKRVKPW